METFTSFWSYYYKVLLFDDDSNTAWHFLFWHDKPTEVVGFFPSLLNLAAYLKSDPPVYIYMHMNEKREVTQSWGMNTFLKRNSPVSFLVWVSHNIKVVSHCQNVTVYWIAIINKPFGTYLLIFFTLLHNYSVNLALQSTLWEYVWLQYALKPDNFVSITSYCIIL